jgi:hypothetical protein
MIAVIQLVVGTIQLFLGRKIFWLMVGILGFLLGLYLTVYVFDLPTWPYWLKLLVGLGVGVIFSILAVFIQKPMAAIFGFFAFGLAAASLARLWGVEANSSLFWIICVVGGVIGVFLVLTLFDWALIIGSSLSGAGMMVTALEVILRFPRTGILSIALFLILLVLGIVYQAKFVKPTVVEA